MIELALSMSCLYTGPPCLTVAQYWLYITNCVCRTVKA